MEEFVRYNSIKSTYKDEYIKQALTMGFGVEEFIVTEKAHGANFQMNYDGHKVTCGRRDGVLNLGDKFHGWETLISRYESQFKIIWDEITKVKQDLTKITLFGELIGGYYNHKEVKKNNHASRVQKKSKIAYSPDLEFYAFEWRVNDEVMPRSALEVVKRTTFFNIAPVLFRGTLLECLEYDSRFESKIYEMFHLPQTKDNLCEGIVITPSKPLYYNSGSRVIFKKVNEEHAEKHKVKKIKEAPVYSAKVNEEIANILSYVTENRLTHVLSHNLEVTIKDFRAISSQMFKDSLDEYLDDRKELIQDMSKADKKIVSRKLMHKCSELVREYFKGEE